jgi:hypothetical protein
VNPQSNINQLTITEAFNAMREFLEGYYERTSSDDVGSLLGDMRFLDDGNTADSAAWNDWIDAVNKNLKKEFKLKKLPPSG